MKSKRSESGMLIVEATIVFPVMFLVIFLMIFAGNAFYQKCRIEAIVSKAAIDGAAFCGDPMLSTVVKTGNVPAFDTVDIEPYRYLFGNMENIAEDIEYSAKDDIEKLNTGLFGNMKPGNVRVNAQFDSKFIYSTFSVHAECKITIPVRLLGMSDYLALKVSTRSDVPVSDVPEMMRNINMIEDYMEVSGAMDKIHEMVDKVKEWFGGK